MVLGISLAAYTAIHVAMSLIGILTGFVVLFGLLKGNRMNTWTLIFLATTAATSVTGFGFPFDRLLPSHIVGMISLVALAIAIAARYPMRLAGPWRKIYVVTSVMALYLNTFVLVIQSFEKSPSLNALAPTQSEPPFVAAQVVLLLAMVVLGIFAVKKFRSDLPMGLPSKAASSGV